MLTNRRSMMAPSNPASHRASTFSYRTAFTEPIHETTGAPQSREPSILTATTPTLPGHSINRVLGTVHGITTCARKDTKSFLKSVGIGNEAKSLTQMLYQARDQAIERMLRDCVSRGGNAVVGVGFNESEVLGFVQVSCYGTAVFVEKEENVFGYK